MTYDADAFMAALFERTRALDDDAARAFCARLVLILADRVGDDRQLAEALALAAQPA